MVLPVQADVPVTVAVPEPVRVLKLRGSLALPSETLPVTVTWDGNEIGQSMTTTDDTGSISVTSGYTTPPEPYLAIVGNPQGTVSVTVGDLTVTESV